MKRIFASVLVLILAAQACNFLTGLTRNGSSNAGGTPDLHPTHFMAQATSGVSVWLAWPAADGAQKYLLDFQTSDSEILPLAELNADQTSYEVIGAPEEMQLTFRLRVQTAAGTSAGETATVTTPQASPAPLSVQANEYKPIQWRPPTPDPKNPVIDPSKLFPPGFDPSNPLAANPADFLQKVEATVQIGPEGGTVSVTTPDKITYTLTIPAGALEAATPISLIPLETIDGLPFSGGLQGAVRIEPDGLQLDLPATLTIVRADAAPLPAGMLNLAFTFDGTGEEFHLYPFAPIGAGSFTPGGVQTIGLSNRPHSAGTLGGVTLSDLKAYGAAAGTAQDAGTVVKAHAPSSPADRLDSSMAYAQAVSTDDLAPLVQITAAAESASFISYMTNDAPDWGQMVNRLEQFDHLLNRHGKDPGLQGDYGKIWDLMLDRLQKMLAENKNKCLTNDDFYAQAVVAKMTSGKPGSFGGQLAARFKTKFGEAAFKDATALSKNCVLNLEVQSQIKSDTPDVAAYIVRVQGTIRNLKFNYSRGKVYLSGEGSLEYGPVDVIPHTTGSYTCEPWVPANTISAWTVLTRLEPVFNDVPNGTVTDFKLMKMQVKDDGVLKGTVKCTNVTSNGTQTTTVKVNLPANGGSVWYGLFHRGAHGGTARAPLALGMVIAGVRARSTAPMNPSSPR